MTEPANLLNLSSRRTQRPLWHRLLAIAQRVALQPHPVTHHKFTWGVSPECPELRHLQLQLHPALIVSLLPGLTRTLCHTQHPQSRSKERNIAQMIKSSLTRQHLNATLSHTEDRAIKEQVQICHTCRAPDSKYNDWGSFSDGDFSALLSHRGWGLELRF